MLSISRNQTFAYEPKKYPNEANIERKNENITQAPKVVRICKFEGCERQGILIRCANTNCGRITGVWCNEHVPECPSCSS
jgi:hypothetical protein